MVVPGFHYEFWGFGSQSLQLLAFHCLAVLPPRLCTLTLLVLPAPPMSLQVLALTSFLLVYVLLYAMYAVHVKLGFTWFHNFSAVFVIVFLWFVEVDSGWNHDHSRQARSGGVIVYRQECLGCAERHHKCSKASINIGALRRWSLTHSQSFSNRDSRVKPTTNLPFLSFSSYYLCVWPHFFTFLPCLNMADVIQGLPYPSSSMLFGCSVPSFQKLPARPLAPWVACRVVPALCFQQYGFVFCMGDHGSRYIVFFHHRFQKTHLPKARLVWNILR